MMCIFFFDNIIVGYFSNDYDSRSEFGRFDRFLCDCHVDLLRRLNDPRSSFEENPTRCTQTLSGTLQITTRLIA